MGVLGKKKDSRMIPRLLVWVTISKDDNISKNKTFLFPRSFSIWRKIQDRLEKKWRDREEWPFEIERSYDWWLFSIWNFQGAVWNLSHTCPCDFLMRTVIVVQALSCVRLFVTPWTVARQASLSFTVSQSLLKLMSIESVMPFDMPFHFLSPPSPALNLSQHQDLFQGGQFFTSGGQSNGVSASASVLPMNIQGWFPLGLTGSKVLAEVE